MQPKPDQIQAPKVPQGKTDAQAQRRIPKDASKPPVQPKKPLWKR